MSDQQKSDMQHLMEQPEFQRFLYRFAIQSAGLFSQGGSGSTERDLAYAMGRRDLALDMLADAEGAQPIRHPDGSPILTTIQILREAAQSAPTEKQNGRRDRYDRNRDLADGDGSDDGPDDL